MKNKNIKIFFIMVVITAAFVIIGMRFLSGKDNSVLNNQEQPIVAHFGCKNGSFIDAKFFNKGEPHVDLVLSDGRNISLPQAISASGARYANTDESFVFWNKGDGAFIEENGKTTFTDCSTIVN